MQCSAELSEPALDNQMSEIRYTPGPLAPEPPLGSHISEFSSPCFTAVLSYSLIPARCWAPQHWATSRGTEGAQHPAELSSGWVMSWVDASWSAVKFTEAWVFCQINASWGSYACPEAFFSVHVLLKKKKNSTVSFVFINWCSPFSSSFALSDFCPHSSAAKKVPLCVRKCPTVHRS